ncbi:MAG TPA: Gmad2 immunoglobulin-like domain-containing protein [Frankiaceae bacterium]|nr:Gmad2 immunoglobulin-like domain-containing protein [Frankiaceae bacterium]
MSRRWIAAVAAAAALTACAGEPQSPGAQPTGSPSESAPPASGSPSATPSPSVTPTAVSPTPVGSMRVAVYYVGGEQRRPVLFREFRSVPRSTGVVREAVHAMLTLVPQDADYYSLWPTGSRVNSVRVDGTTAIVDLAADSRRVNATKEIERASLQQLVHTVTAAAPALRSVRVLFDGKTAPTLWGDVATTGPISRGAQVDTLAPIWVVEPAQGAKVSRTFTVKGTATVFEATVSWAVTRPGSTTKIVDGYVTATEGAPGRGSFTVTVKLPAGTTGDVVFTAWESSAEDGSVQHPDSKTYRVG